MKFVANNEERSKSLLPIHVITLGTDHIQEPRTRPQGAAFHHVLFVEQGCGIFETGSTQLQVEAGNAIFLEKDTAVNYYGKDKTFRTGWVTFDGPGAGDLLDYYHAKHMACRPIHRLSSGAPAFCKLIEQDASAAKLSAELYELLRSFFEDTATPSEPHFAQAKRYLLQHYGRDISVAELANATGISPSLLYRKFREANTTPTEFLRQVRINKAKELLLQNPQARIREIAAACGFSDLAYFCKVFRESVGETPRAFREKYRA